MTLMLTFLKQISVLLLLSTSAFASIGSVNELKGKGEIDRKDGDAGIQLEQDLDVFSYDTVKTGNCLLYTSPSPRDRQKSRMPSSA